MTREERYIEYDERIDRYLRYQMSDDERTAFEQDVDNDQELRERLLATAMLVQGIAQEGMRREGQTQLDAIKKMSEEKFKQATKRQMKIKLSWPFITWGSVRDDAAIIAQTGRQSNDNIKQMNSDKLKRPDGNKSRRPMWSFMKWAAGIAAVAFMAYGLYTFYPLTSKHQSEMADVIEEAPEDIKVADKPVKPTLAVLVDKYNRPFDNEPDAFISIREQIQQGSTKDMMAVVDEIDRIEWPTTNHEPKGAADDIVFKETLSNYNDFTHWYKALAYLKADDKESAINELNEVIDHSTVEELVNRASDLLKKLKK